MKTNSSDLEIAELSRKMRSGDMVSLARLITLVENDDVALPAIMKQVYDHSYSAYHIGITGPPGAGKSTIVDRLTQAIRKDELTVGIVCADPTSPFTGGALLGDRIRMQQHYLDDGVYIRSMATRGSQGGLPVTSGNVIKLLGASGKDYVLVETVGVGQTELDIMENVDATVVVLTPEGGDAIQTMKAGLFEIADIFVVNKADRTGAERLMMDLKNMLLNREGEDCWQIPVISTEAINNKGIDILYTQTKDHRRALEQSGQFHTKRKEQRRAEFMRIIEKRIRDKLLGGVQADNKVNEYIAMVENAEVDPYTAADKVFQSITGLSGQ
jgi:LAO/AO transport system kinase